MTLESTGPRDVRVVTVAASRRRSPRLLGSFAVAVAVVFGGVPASAGDKAPLSSLPTLPAPRDRPAPPKDHGVPGLVIKEHASAARTYLELLAVTSQGYCLVNREHGLRLDSSTTSLTDDSNELWRLVEKDGKTTLERTRYEVATDANSAWVKSKASIELREVTRSHGVTVWGYRDTTGDVVLLARGANEGREVRPPKRDDDGSIDFVSSDCTFGAARLSIATAKGGTLAQLRGTLPPVGEGKAKVIPQFVIDGSLAKLSRDPEPVLTVRVRLQD